MKNLKFLFIILSQLLYGCELFHNNLVTFNFTKSSTGEDAGIAYSDSPFVLGRNKYFFGVIRAMEVDRNNNLYVYNATDNLINVYDENGNIKGTINCPSHLGSFTFVRDIAVDNNGQIFVADSNNDRILVYDQNFTFQFTFGSSGTSAGQFDIAHSIQVDNLGRVYVSDANNDRIQVFTLSGSTVTSVFVIGVGGDLNLDFNYPTGIYLDQNQKLYIADTNNHRIRIINNDFTHDTDFGTIGSGNLNLTLPRDIAVDSGGMIYILDSDNDRIQVLDASLNYAQTIDETNLTSLSSLTSFSKIESLVFGPGETLHLVHNSPGTVFILDHTGNEIQSYSSSGKLLGQLNYPFSLAINSRGHTYVSELFNNRVQIFAPDGRSLGNLITDSSPDFPSGLPAGIRIDDQDNIYLCDTTNSNVLIFNSDHLLIDSINGSDSIGGTFGQPSNIELDSYGNIYIADFIKDRIVVYDPDLNFLFEFDGTTGAGGKLDNPVDIKIFDNKIFVTDYGNQQIQIFDLMGQNIDNLNVDPSNSNPLFSIPYSIDINSKAQIYVTDLGTSEVIKLKSDGTVLSRIKRIDPDTRDFFQPTSVRIDKWDNIYISDAFNNRIFGVNENLEFLYFTE